MHNCDHHTNTAKSIQPTFKTAASVLDKALKAIIDILIAGPDHNDAAVGLDDNLINYFPGELSAAALLFFAFGCLDKFDLFDDADRLMRNLKLLKTMRHLYLTGLVFDH